MLRPTVPSVPTAPCRPTPGKFLSRPAGIALVSSLLLIGRAPVADAQSRTTPPISAPPETISGPVAATRASRLAGFERRRVAGRGTFLTRADLQRRRVARLSDILRATPGVALVPVSGSGYAVASTRPGWHTRPGAPPTERGACYLDVLLDGVRLTPSPSAMPVDIDDIAPSRLAGIEIHRAAAIPIELPAGPGSCGVLAMWSAEP